jgi:hypothetical protein
MPKDRASRRNKFNHWDDDELDVLRSSGKEDRKLKNGIHTNRKERLKTKQGRSNDLSMGIDQVQWLKPVQDLVESKLMDESGEFALDAEISLSLAEIKELAARIEQIIATTAGLMQSVRGCGIDFGPDMDRQFTDLKKIHLEIEAQIQEQTRSYNQESKKLQQSLGEESALVVAEMIRFESKKQSAYHFLHRQCKKLLADAQAFHEGIEGLAWNLDQCV